MHTKFDDIASYLEFLFNVADASDVQLDSDEKEELISLIEYCHTLDKEMMKER